jgi:hypothetical protein
MPLSKPFAQKALACPVAAKRGHVWVIGTHIDFLLRNRAKRPQRPKGSVWTPFAPVKSAGVQFVDCRNIHPADTDGIPPYLEPRGPAGRKCYGPSVKAAYGEHFGVTLQRCRCSGRYPDAGALKSR